MGTRFTKRRIAKPDDARLKFFTRELYAKFNSIDDRVANEADEEWEQAIEDYRGHLRRIKSKLPLGARRLTKVSLHDAELIDKPRTCASGQWGRIAIVGGMTIEKSTIHLLKYELAAGIERIHCDVAWPFSNVQVQWLYDELDISNEHKDCFIHRILFSDGSVVVVPFKDAQVQTWPSELLQDLMPPKHPTNRKKVRDDFGRQSRAITSN
jgi:hypothetical protein